MITFRQNFFSFTEYYFLFTEDNFIIILNPNNSRKIYNCMKKSNRLFVLCGCSLIKKPNGPSFCKIFVRLLTNIYLGMLIVLMKSYILVQHLNFLKSVFFIHCDLGCKIS